MSGLVGKFEELSPTPVSAVKLVAVMPLTLQAAHMNALGPKSVRYGD